MKDVLIDIEEILHWAKREQNRIGYFAALYKHVAMAVIQAVNGGEFENGPLLATLDATFFSRYLDALESFRKDRTCTKSWKVAFEATEQPSVLLVQHLALGMNAHIDLDLAIATAQCVPADQMATFQPDFEHMNTVLASVLVPVLDDLATLQPLWRIANRLGGKAETTVIDCALVTARKLAWERATVLARLSPRDRAGEMIVADDAVATLGHVLRKPGVAWWPLLALLRLEESSNVAEVITRLEHTARSAVARRARGTRTPPLAA
jgi:hypothetical protein